MSEPTRPIHQPRIESDGSLVAHTVATPTSFKVRARVTVGSRKVIPVIFVPGIMGSNLRAKLESKGAPNAVMKPGEPAWRPPNTIPEALSEALKWKRRNPSQRQQILDVGTLEVDPDGPLDYPVFGLDPDVMQERGWGEVHADSYGSVLVDLHRHLDKTFLISPKGVREVRPHWRRVMQCEPSKWGLRSVTAITETDLERYAVFQYPVYAFGYNWLESCEVSGRRLRKRIDDIKKFWADRKHECRHVILVTHSMGGLVARACARLSPPGDGSAPDIAGIVHSVMPALGAPVAYRRIACGTETGIFINHALEKIKAAKFAEIAGMTSAQTTPVMAVAPGVLQLLPNHLYPKPWLLIKTVRTVNRKDEERDLLALPDKNPYDFYRDMQSWYRMIDPQLADPAGRYVFEDGGATRKIVKAIDEAERFHTEVLMKSGGTRNAGEPYFHPKTYAFYGADSSLKAYGKIRWIARESAGGQIALTTANIRAGKFVSLKPDGSREVAIENRQRLSFFLWSQDESGDETVPAQSGAGVSGYAKQVFATEGYRHQDCFQNDSMLLLTRHLIVKIVQDIR